ncbi:hypothetical protein DFH07DRAFT_742154 [Mycena maculata]|uniref:HAT C-terminal dimerisation domain-containing protein n=1 Tax=Mycena maculata TaxID=230809 RepID=A0AAD7J5G6_9AGAR|nr:hypothetical protein DFH07DRAFT_742154 [Mycena maculata]
MVILLPVKSWSYCDGFFSSWWANSLSTHLLVEGTLPFMVCVARDILAIPGLSISVEHLFSSVKHTLLDACSSMTAEWT